MTPLGVSSGTRRSLGCGSTSFQKSSGHNHLASWSTSDVTDRSCHIPHQQASCHRVAPPKLGVVSRLKTRVVGREGNWRDHRAQDAEPARARSICASAKHPRVRSIRECGLEPSRRGESPRWCECTAKADDASFAGLLHQCRLRTLAWTRVVRRVAQGLLFFPRRRLQHGPHVAASAQTISSGEKPCLARSSFVR